MQVTPALPWEGNDGGTIELAQPVTFAELLDGALQYVISGNGETVVAAINEGSNGLNIGYIDDNAFNIVYSIARFEGSLSTLQVTKDTGEQAEGYVLSEVNLTVNYGGILLNAMTIMGVNGEEQPAEGETGVVCGLIEDQETEETAYVGFTQDGRTVIAGTAHDVSWTSAIGAEFNVEGGVNVNSVLPSVPAPSFLAGKLIPVSLVNVGGKIAFRPHNSKMNVDQFMFCYINGEYATVGTTPVYLSEI